MAVTITFVEFNGSQPEHSQGSGPVVSNLNLGNTDARNLVPATYPITAGTNSYAKFVQAQFSGSFTTITNAKFWKSSGAYGTGEDIMFSGSYSKITPATTALAAVGGKAVATVPTASPSAQNVWFAKHTNRALFTKAQVPNMGQAQSSPGYYSGSRTSTMALQMQTTSSAVAGATAQKVFTLSYDRT